MLKTYIEVKNFYWEGLKREVKRPVAKYDLCQKIKYDTRPPAGLLLSLPIPNEIWKDLSMEFIEGLSKSKGNKVILVLVDRLSKYGHVILIKYHYTGKSVAKAFVDYVFRLYGFLRSIVTNKYRVCMSSFWNELFELQGSRLKVSFS